MRRISASLWAEWSESPVVVVVFEIFERFARVAAFFGGCVVGLEDAVVALGWRPRLGGCNS